MNHQPLLGQVTVWIGLLLLGVGLHACAEPSGFEALAPEDSGVTFANQIEPSVDFSILDYPYFYNGGGVAVADFDQDGLQDLFFTANQGENRIYKNLGKLKFEDLTSQSEVGGPATEWSTGVAVVDINADGLPDLYVCYLGGELGQTGRNRLYVNEGDFRFREAAEEYGLAIGGMCTQAAFFDYDHDGDLDCYLLKHSVKPAEVLRDTALRHTRDPFAGDQLLRNDNGQFVDVSEAAGISGSRLGYGLNVLVTDWNQDGWPDLYVCNDFQEEDYLYLNQQNGSFRSELRAYVGHTSRFSMGSDVADLNADGYPDLLSLDMKPAREDILKTAEAPEPYNSYRYKLTFGYYHQFPHNALQMSQGAAGHSEMAQLAGIDATDWSWSALFCDLNQDGQQDVFITNGIARRPNDMDYIKFLSDPDVKRELSNAPTQAHLRFIDRMPSVPLPNPIMIRDSGSLHFTDMAEAWGAAQPRFSTGAAYADLDNDGDLDLIENNINAPAGILANHAALPASHSLQLELRQSGKNPFCLGSTVTVFVGNQKLSREVTPIRGFLSSQPTRVHVAWVSAAAQADSVQVRWPDGSYSHWTKMSAEPIQTLKREEGNAFTPQISSSQALYSPASLPTEGNSSDVENEFVDFDREPLIPHMLSQQGPAVATADLNGDGIEDIFVGGLAGQSATMWMSAENGSWEYVQPQAFLADAGAVDVDAAFVDVDGDGKPELYVVSGGYEFPAGDGRYQDRIYVQTAAGWEKDTTRFPFVTENGACVTVLDLESDGDMDLFVGSRAVPGSYGISPKSCLWVNDGSGHFTESASAAGLDSIGMITSAAWLDWTGDGKKELVTAGEWEPIRVWSLATQTGQVKELGPGILQKSNGWWNCLKAMDLDGDGDEDLLAGNLGWNSDLRASHSAPCLMYVKDFDRNGSTDPVICKTIEGKHYPWASRDELLGQLAFLRRKYPSYASFSDASIENVFDPEVLRSSLQKQVFTFSTIWIENAGNGEWLIHELPYQAQAAPVYAAALLQANDDAYPDLLLGGNLFGVGPKRGRYDASRGLLLLGDGKGSFSAILPQESGINIPGETRAIVPIKNDSLIWFFRYREAPILLKKIESASH
ncbi:MAG: VCBS repeat-containing protein [Bacteroidia bacterium]|nr:VCBS repeat-containing protein [Bacteroidia bacterium]